MTEFISMESKSVFRDVRHRSNIRLRQCGTETCLRDLSEFRQQKNEPWVLDLVLLDSYYIALHAMQVQRLFGNAESKPFVRA